MSYFDSITAEINQATSCAQLQKIATQVLPQLNSQLAAIGTQLSAFGAIQSLLTPPASNPGAIVTWITTLISDYLGPQLAAYAKLAVQVTELTANIASITAAISTKAGSFPNCTVPV